MKENLNLNIYRYYMYANECNPYILENNCTAIHVYKNAKDLENNVFKELSFNNSYELQDFIFGKEETIGE